ncbi:hypothetical protein ADIS_4514 [Lunatimonas lonarensis]|uniref:Uncharacterized protein n=1 Tax=Lunatimonas lonarensis TaxID=1232681 RepID=R7ZLQ1_9BACT|nr:hypothetical protein ADIS_4514 [Lunatimonas lonarensis]
MVKSAKIRELLTSLLELVLYLKVMYVTCSTPGSQVNKEFVMGVPFISLKNTASMV